MVIATLYFVWYSVPRYDVDDAHLIQRARDEKSKNSNPRSVKITDGEMPIRIHVHVCAES